MFAILGSGFGLYGYLPALVAEGERVALPERYRVRFDSRVELARYAEAVRWFREEAEALDHADGVVVALRPSDQVDWIPRCLARPNVGQLLLEKPLSYSPDSAAAVLADLARAGVQFRIGYTFPYAAWASRVREFLSISPQGRLSIEWRFLAHHYDRSLHNWKRFTSQGGGALRFYGIQLIAFLAEVGYADVVDSSTVAREPGEAQCWKAIFAGPGLPHCDVLVDSLSITKSFAMRYALGDHSTPLFKADDPFSSEVRQAEGIDRRVSILAAHVRSLMDDAPYASLYQAINRLWRCVEDRTRSGFLAGQTTDAPARLD